MKASTSTPAATTKTTDIASEKPTRNGLASAGSRWLMNELSDSAALPTPAPEPPDCCAAWSCSAKALLVAGSPPVGLRRAAWNAGVGAIDANASEILVPACEKRIDRKTAVPSVPPIWRVKVADE